MSLTDARTQSVLLGLDGTVRARAFDESLTIKPAELHSREVNLTSSKLALMACGP